MNLISMTDFILERVDNITTLQLANESVAYAKFLKQPLTLGMFVPCDENGNVLDEPNYYNCFLDRSYVNHPQLINYENCVRYKKAKENILFKGAKHNDIQPSTDWNFYSLKGNKIAEANNLGRYNLIYRLNTVEDLINRIKDVELTESALKQIEL